MINEKNLHSKEKKKLLNKKTKGRIKNQNRMKAKKGRIKTLSKPSIASFDSFILSFVILFNAFFCSFK
jgi:hypothetical protein